MGHRVRNTEQVFEEIIEDALGKAYQVQCTLEEFIEQLNWWVDPNGPIYDEINAASENL